LFGIADQCGNDPQLISFNMFLLMLLNAERASNAPSRCRIPNANKAKVRCVRASVRQIQPLLAFGLFAALHLGVARHRRVGVLAATLSPSDCI
jgi:hypothetical protein